MIIPGVRNRYLFVTVEDYGLVGIVIPQAKRVKRFFDRASPLITGDMRVHDLPAL